MLALAGIPLLLSIVCVCDVVYVSHKTGTIWALPYAFGQLLALAPLAIDAAGYRAGLIMGDILFAVNLLLFGPILVKCTSRDIGVPALTSLALYAAHLFLFHASYWL